MDDFLVFGDEKRMLQETLDQVRAFLRHHLLLELKEAATILAPVSQGVPFLGFRIYPGVVRLEGKKWARFRRDVRKRERAYLDGLIGEEYLVQSISSMIGHIQHADTLSARRRFFEGSLSLG
jgi:hypothetical protein